MIANQQKRIDSDLKFATEATCPCHDILVVEYES